MLNRLALLVVLVSSAVECADVLWYRTPAANWNEALPIGNGRLAAMVFGGTSQERIQLNESSVWAGEYRDRVNPDASKSLSEVRALLAAGKVQQAQELADKSMIAIPRRLAPYQTLGDLTLDIRAGEGVAYRRELDLDQAIATTRYLDDGANFVRETFVSAPDDVVVVRLSAYPMGRMSFSAALRRESDATSAGLGKTGLVMEGDAIVRREGAGQERPVGVHFVAMLRAISEGGTIRVEGARLIVENANAVTLLLTAATSFRERDPRRKCAAVLDAAAAKAYADLRAAHVADHRKLYRRMRLDLGSPANTTEDLTTSELLDRAAADRPDARLEALYFQFARYLMIACSRPGGLPATLQGLWNQSLNPPWDSKYTVNINTEMNYWLPEPANLAETHLPLFDLIDRVRANDGKRVAKEMYGAGGFVIHHNTDMWGHAVPVDGARFGMWPMGGAWLSLHYWDHYDYGLDRAFLQARAYPALKAAAEFLLGYMVTDASGLLVTGPSMSPENQYKTADGQRATVTMGPYMDTEIAREVFSRAAAAAKILGVDAEFRDAAIAASAKLAPFRIGKFGQLQEWITDYEDAEPGHRHISHLFALHPASQITPRATPELARAARVSLERRLKNNSGQTGWSRAWIVNFWARLGEGDLAHDSISVLLAKSTLPNLFDNHPPFQIDGNFGGAAGMLELLLQSHSGEIHLLPALPAAWPSGRVTGVRARGGVEADVSWRGGTLSAATLRTQATGPVTVRVAKLTTVTVRQNGSIVRSQMSDGAVTFDAVRGAVYTIQAR